MTKVKTDVIYKRSRVQLNFDSSDENSRSRTQQHFKDECNFNKIIAKFQKTGLLTHVRDHQGQYSDFSVVPSYDEALIRVQEAHEMFMTIPASIRFHFNNNPGQFLDFVENPDNRDKMIEMGLIPQAFDQAVQNLNNNSDVELE